MAATPEATLAAGGRCVSTALEEGTKSSGVERAVALVTRPNRTVLRDGCIVLAVAGSLSLVGCGSDRAGGTAGTSAQTTAVAWPEAKAVRYARRASLVVDGQRQKIDASTVVCWGVGRGDGHDERRVWRRFRCIAPTFRGAQAGPDVLFVLQPTGRRTFTVLNQRLSSY
jgi:hypothetical protein